MDCATISSTPTDFTSTKDSCEDIFVKLRRLKIEESVLCKSINTKIKELTTEENEDNYPNYLQSKQNSFLECRDLLEEIKINTNCQENLQSVDIEDIKKDVINLETKIQNFKTSLQTHLTRLIQTEKELKREIDENPQRLRRSQKLQKKTFSEIVPSPVKMLIKSGFKCSEVQEFQEFMSYSKNRYGGWIPYNHDIFEKTWQKYFRTQKNIEDFEYQDVNVENCELFQIFLNEVSRKIPEAETNDIIAHNKWYTKYIYLKERQQRALEKWRMKKQIRQRTKSQTREDEKFKKVKDKNLYLIHRNAKGLESRDSDEFKSMMRDNFSAEIDGNVLDEKESRYVALELFNLTCNEVENIACKQIVVPKIGVNNFKAPARQSAAYKNPTQQWNNRCNGDKDHSQLHINVVDNIRKRRIPDWRLGLQN